jgi:hypothetical protein
MIKLTLTLDSQIIEEQTHMSVRMAIEGLNRETPINQLSTLFDIKEAIEAVINNHAVGGEVKRTETIQPMKESLNVTTQEEPTDALCETAGQ